MLQIFNTVSKCSNVNKKFSCLTQMNPFLIWTNIKSMSTSTSTAEKMEDNVKDKTTEKTSVSKPRSLRSHSLVSAAFASLEIENKNLDIQTPVTDKKLTEASSIDELLSLSEGSGVSRKHAITTVSILSNWWSSGKIALADFESDPRFLKLCRILTKNNNFTKPRRSLTRSEDLSTILSVTADDEAAKLVRNLTLPQMVKVMSTLCQKKRRSTMLLRALSYNITASQEKLDLKQCADLLYSIALLSFPDENLLGRLSNDICSELHTVGELKSSSVIGSIIRSVGVLRYKEPVLLDGLCDWVLKYYGTSRPQDVFSLFMTLGVLNYLPSNAESLFKTLVPQLSEAEAGKPSVWLDIVWSLVLLSQADHQHLASVLETSFIEKWENKNDESPSAKLKLLNIDAAAAQLYPQYRGPHISEQSPIRAVEIPRTKEKSEMLDIVIDSLGNLMQNEKYLQTNVNTGAGFYIDIECVLDAKCNPILVSSEKNRSDITKVAFLVHDFSDMCIGKIEPTGVNAFASKLLQKQGYKVIVIPYLDFNIRDKVVNRVKYIEKQLKKAVTSQGM